MLESVIQALQAEQEKAYNNPWATTGQSLSQISPLLAFSQDDSMSSRDRIIGSLATGLAGGLMSGYGKSQAESKMQEFNGVLNSLVGTYTQGGDISQYASDPRLSSVVPALRLEQAAAESAAKQKLMEKQQDFMLRAQYEPMIESGKASAMLPIEQQKMQQKYEMDAAYLPGIEGAKSAASYSASLPYKMQEESFKRGMEMRDPAKMFDKETGLRKEFEALDTTKSFRPIQNSFNSMIKSYNDTSKASDLDFVYGVAKILDPDSVVREGEAIQVIKTGGLPGELMAMIGRVNAKQGLDKELRSELLGLAANRYNSLKQTYDENEKDYSRMATGAGLNPSNVILQPTPPDAYQLLGQNDIVPPGMKLQRNKTTGETRLVPQ